MGFQFIHLESFSRKADSSGRGTDFIFAEASRKPDASVHVQNPAPPTVVYGVGVEAVQEIHDAAVDAARISVEGGKTRKIRRDQKTLHTVVASHPYTMAEIRDDPAKRKEAEEWEKRTVSWLRSQYGDDLRSVIRHEDESHYHLHAYTLPQSDPGFKALKFHPGTTAKREIMAAGPVDGEGIKALSKRADAAYKASMRQWQDSYHESVGIPCGLTRLGPQRRRLTRDEWQKEKVQAQALKKTIQRARELKDSGEAFLDRTKERAAAIQADALKRIEDAKRITATAAAAQDHARKARQEATDMLSNAQRYSGWAGRLRAVWDGFRKSRIAEAIRKEFAADVERVQVFAKTVQERLKEEERKRREAERQAHEAARETQAARDAALRAYLDRDRAYAMLPREKLDELAMSTPTMQHTLRPTANGTVSAR
ncbi:UNVERIFIED_ORG: hypothetical protein J2W85_000775 [Ensifer adhaerens]|nr:hypothetical protein [Ensifer adhaerens]